MTFENMNTDDFFPLLQQTLSDTFKIDSYLMHGCMLLIRILRKWIWD